MSYLEFEPLFKAGGFRVIPCSLPGRGHRMDEKLSDVLPDLAQDIAEQILSQWDEEYMIFGHSMGAALAVHTTWLLSQNNKSLPKGLILSGRGGEIKKPSTPFKSQMNTTDLFNLLKSYGGLPEQALNNTDIMEYLYPIIRSDFRSIESYLPVDCFFESLPVFVFYGSQEDFNDREAYAWQRISNIPLIIKKFKGNHFFVFQYKNEIVSLIQDCMMQPAN